MQRQRIQKKSELKIGIELMTFCTIAGYSTAEPWELIWWARILCWVHSMTHGLYHTDTWTKLVCHGCNDRPWQTNAIQVPVWYGHLTNQDHIIL